MLDIAEVLEIKACKKILNLQIIRLKTLDFLLFKPFGAKIFHAPDGTIFGDALISL